MPLKAVLFDVDGTLVDSVDAHARAWQDAIREFGHDLPLERIRSKIGMGGDQLMPALLPRAFVEREGERLEKRRGEIFRERYLPDLKPLPGAQDLVKRMDKAGVRVALASSAKEEELAALKRIVGIGDGNLDAETSADDAERSKPHPDIFLAALEQLQGATPDETVVVGDTPYDVEAARKAGMQCIAVLSGGFPEEDLRRAGAVAVYRDAADLLAQFDVSPLAAGTATD